MKHLHTLVSLLLVALFGSAALAQSNGYDIDWFTPDIVTIKKDPHDQIHGDFGQPAGGYNWNADQFALMGRTKKTCNGCTKNGLHVAIQNLTLFVNDEEFFIKAMCYNPVPLGIVSMQKTTGIGGGGLCSARRTPFATNDYKSACYDSDYFDGSDAPGRYPVAPSNGWFTNVWLRDFPIIKSLGVNTIRIYNANPTTKMYTDAVLKGTQTAITGQIVAPSYGKDHRPFMDAAYAAGLKVIFPLLGDENLMKNLQKDQYQRYLQNQIDEVGNHPALLMWTVGNELNLGGDPQLLAMVNEYIAYARQYTMNKWGRSIPITHAIVDNPPSYNNLFANLNVDVFTSNAGYRGPGFQDLWTGEQTPGFDGLGPLSVKYNKPNFIGEMGWEQVNGSETANIPGWFNQKWKDLIVKGTPNGCIGGAFFEYMDEPYSKDDVKQQSMGVVAPRVSSLTDTQSQGTEVPPTVTVFGVNTGYTVVQPSNVQTTVVQVTDVQTVTIQASGSTMVATSTRKITLPTDEGHGTTKPQSSSNLNSSAATTSAIFSLLLVSLLVLSVL